MTSAGLPSVRAKALLGALLKSGYEITRSRGSHRFLRHPDGRTMVFAFHDRENVGPRMLARVLKDAGLSYEKIEKYL